MRLRTAVVFGILVLVLTLSAGAQLVVDRTYLTALDTAESTINRTGRAAEGIVNNQLLQVDSALASLPTLISGASPAPGGTLQQQGASRLLQGMNFQSLAFRDLLIVRPDGEVWASARSTSRNRTFPIAPEDVTARTSPGSSAVLGPIRNASTGDWVIYLVRPVQLPGLGAANVAAEVPITSLTAPLATIADLPGLRIAIARGDGSLVASLPHDELNIGRPLKALKAPRADPGAPIPTVGENGRLSHYRIVRPTLYGDIHVDLLLDATVATADWARDRERLTIGLMVVFGMLGLFGFVVLWGLRRQERLDEDRRQAQALLEDAIESMSDGFVMWDAEDRLVTCNSTYLQLYDRSAASIRPGMTFTEIIRKGVELGQYPQAGDDVEAFVQRTVDFHRAGEGSFERLLPDGRWILVTERPTASGGSVGMRKDITERKRQEELILQYSRELERLATRFENSVKLGAAKLESSARDTHVEVDTMVSAASEALSQARVVSSAAETTSSSVGVIAARSEQLLTSINRVLDKVQAAARMADHAADISRVATQVMESLDDAASRITTVVDLIGSIANQTNLLALNATIEAARAGEAGRGFAVVAGEVKALAAQTTRSTDSIAQQVRAIQHSSLEASGSIEAINTIIDQLKDIAGAIEQAVLEQSHAASEIAASTQATASSTSHVSQAVLMIADRSERISRSTEGLRSTAQQLLADAHMLGSESERFLASVKARN